MTDAGRLRYAFTAGLKERSKTEKGAAPESGFLITGAVFFFI